MDVQELSNLFDTLLQPSIVKDNFGEQNTLAFDEYEKYIFLTKAQEQIVLELYQELEQSEENRKYLSNLIKTENYVPVGEQDYTLINNVTDITNALIDSPVKKGEVKAFAMKK